MKPESFSFMSITSVSGMRLSLSLVLFFSIWTQYVSSFYPLNGSCRLNNVDLSKTIRESNRISQLQMFVNDSSTVTTVVGGATTNSEKSTSTNPAFKDRNDTAFQLQSSVKIIAPNIRAYHVSSKGFGSFSQESSAFIPASENAVRKEKCLVLPVGLIGKVTQIFDSVDSDSSLPFQVKFSPGESGNYDVPVAFTMHLDTTEVEVVIS